MPGTEIVNIGSGSGGSGEEESRAADVGPGRTGDEEAASRREAAAARIGRRGTTDAEYSEKSWRTQEDSNLWPLPSEGSALSS